MTENYVPIFHIPFRLFLKALLVMPISFYILKVLEPFFIDTFS